MSVLGRIIETKKNRYGQINETDKGWTCDLIPKDLIVARFFAIDQSEIDDLHEEFDSVVAELTELEEEHGGEGDVFAELENVNKANITVRLKEVKGDKTAKEEAASRNDPANSATIYRKNSHNIV